MTLCGLEPSAPPLPIAAPHEGQFVSLLTTTIDLVGLGRFSGRWRLLGELHDGLALARQVLELDLRAELLRALAADRDQ
jgi:hypothetical protein